VGESISIQCPHCGESFGVAMDVSEGSAEFVVDCEVCCRPMTVAVRLQDGEVQELTVTPD
jgi:transcription elongation factor Elf1